MLATLLVRSAQLWPACYVSQSGTSRPRRRAPAAADLRDLLTPARVVGTGSPRTSAAGPLPWRPPDRPLCETYGTLSYPLLPPERPEAWPCRFVACRRGRRSRTNGPRRCPWLAPDSRR